VTFTFWNDYVLKVLCLETFIVLKALPEMENTDEIVFGRTDDGPLSQSCPVCSCKKKMDLDLFSYGILHSIWMTIWHLLR
jgi:hypothetical protein